MIQPIKTMFQPPKQFIAPGEQQHPTLKIVSYLNLSRTKTEQPVDHVHNQQGKDYQDWT